MKAIIIVTGIILVLYSALIMAIGKKKAWCHMRWFLAVVPLGLFSFTAYVVYPFAYLWDRYIGKYNPFWFWLDDHIKDSNENADWLIWLANNGGKKNFITMYKWHVNRNRMFNVVYMVKPKCGRINCEKSTEKIVELIKDDLQRSGKKVSVFGNCLAQAELKWIDKNGNEGWQVNQGETISLTYTTWGVSEMYYEVDGTLYYRYSYCFPKMICGKKHILQVKYGTDHKGYWKTLKINRVKE